MTRLRIEEKEEAGEVIQISSHPRWKRAYPCEQYTLQAARKFLGGGFFRKALLEWSIEELRGTIAHPECGFTDAFDAYSAILRFRLTRGTIPAPVIQLNQAA